MPNFLQRGVVTFVFDDGYQKAYENALPILDKHKLPGVFALPIDGSKLEQSQHRYVKKPQTVRSWKDWLHIRNKGHEIAAHSVTHTNLTKVSTEQLEQELKESKERLNAESFVYPGGAHNDTVIEETRTYYKAARTVRRGFETIPPKDPYRLKTFNYSRNNYSVWKANFFTFWAWLTNAWIIETYHMVDIDDSEMVHTVKTSELEQHVAFVAWLPIKVKTLRDVLKGSE